MIQTRKLSYVDNNGALAIDDLTDCEDDHYDEAEELVCNRGFMKEHCFIDGSAKYAIKEVKQSLEGRSLADGAIDICIEAKILSIISHPNIVKLWSVVYILHIVYMNYDPFSISNDSDFCSPYRLLVCAVA